MSEKSTSQWGDSEKPNCFDQSNQERKAIHVGCHPNIWCSCPVRSHYVQLLMYFKFTAMKFDHRLWSTYQLSSCHNVSSSISKSNDKIKYKIQGVCCLIHSSIWGGIENKWNDPIPMTISLLYSSNTIILHHIHSSGILRYILVTLSSYSFDTLELHHIPPTFSLYSFYTIWKRSKIQDGRYRRVSRGL